MPDNKSPVERIKKFAKFVWRHFFTLADISLSINVLIYDNLLWKNALISLSIAITIDWAKQFIKLTPNSKRAHSSYNNTVSTNSSNNHWSDPYVVGSDAYLIRKSRDNY